MYKIVLVDGEREISEQALNLSPMFKSYVSFSKTKTLYFLNNSYPNFNFDCQLFDLYLKWADIHLTHSPSPDLKGLSRKELQFFLHLSKESLCEMLHFAEFMNSENLLEAITSFIAWDFDRRPIDEIRKDYGIAPDFMKYEEDSIRAEIADY